MKIKTMGQLVGECRDKINLDCPLALANVRGTLQFYDLKAQVEGIADDSEVHWILRAQIGTLEKLEGLIPHDRVPSSIELLAAARNLFENLVWLKLFLLNSSWGLFFYGQLLKNREEDLLGMIAKVESEADLFDKFDAQDTSIIDRVYEGIGKLTDLDDGYLAERKEKLDALQNELDVRARRTFALYAAAATYNGYSYQAYLLRTKVIPGYREQLEPIQKRIAAFRSSLADQATADRYLGKWNWRGEAQRVGMAEQYDFLYRLTSRLLHATPVNIVSEKDLIEWEQIALMEYITITIYDILDAIGSFNFPGKVDAVYISVDEEGS